MKCSAAQTLALLLVTCSCGQRESQTQAQSMLPRFDDAFWAHWSDGKAELSAYDLKQPRYGELRQGIAVAVFVTEPFSQTLRVKADPGKHPEDDVFQVMKLNLVEDFQTGIYDYNLMTSVFVSLRQHPSGWPGSPTKVSFSAQEWCGHVYHQVLFDTRRLREVSHSYFDGESDRMADLAYPQGGITGDALLYVARGFSGPVLARGQSLELPYLPTLKHTRLAHEPLAWTTAKLERAAATRMIDTALGPREVESLTLRTAQGYMRTIYVETASPRRVLGWEASDGERASFIASMRSPYWQQHGEGSEALLEQLGLKRRPPRAP